MSDRDRDQLKTDIEAIQKGLLEVMASDRLPGRVKERLRQIAADLIEYTRRLDAVWDVPPRGGEGIAQTSILNRLFDLMVAAWSLLTGNGDDNPTCSPGP